MPVYAREDINELFHMAVSSVFKNTLQPKAFVLVVDGPVSQGLKNQIIAFEINHQIKVIWLPKNVGIANALNIGLKKVQTEWVIRADADDYNLPNRFSELVKLMTNDIDIVGSAIEEVDRDGVKIAIRSPPLKHNDIVNFARYRSPFNHMAVAYRTKIALMCGGYPNIFLKEDYALWALMFQNGARSANTPMILVKATAGRDMYKRRGGLRYAKSEIELQHHLVVCGVKGIIPAIFHGFIRSIIFIIPQFIRGWIYVNFLRKQ
jgi:glycosyltransferase involved in cell wall biosynthesis